MQERELTKLKELLRSEDEANFKLGLQIIKGQGGLPEDEELLALLEKTPQRIVECLNQNCGHYIKHLNCKDNTSLIRRLREMPNLQTLEMNRANLGELPKEVYGLKNLQKLAIERNSIQSFDSDIAHLEKLEDVRTAWAPNICRGLELVPNLKHVSLKGCSIQQDLEVENDGLYQMFKRHQVIKEKISAAENLQRFYQICEQGQLETLDISFNEIRTFPKEMLELKYLTNLDWSTNKHIKSRRGLEKLEHLETLSLAEQYTTVIPKQIYDLPKLRDLDLAANQIRSWKGLEQLQDLEILRLYETVFSKFPEFLTKMSKLKRLNIKDLSTGQKMEKLKI